jgi:mRNA interferase HigB
MKVLGKPIIDKFWVKHANARGALRAWVDDVECSIWKTPQDVKARYSSASFLAGNVVIFNIRGNKFRLEVRVAYAPGVVRVLDVSTHAEYDKRNKKRKPQSK